MIESSGADEEPWTALDELFTESWMLHVEASLALAQVVERQVRIGNSREAAAERVGNNDLANTDDVRTRSRKPDFFLNASAAHAEVLQDARFDFAGHRRGA